MFVTDPEEEKKRKEKEKQETLDDMIKKYRDEIKKERLEQKNEKEKVEAIKISSLKTWMIRLAKCLSPALAAIGVGCFLWVSGEFVKWVSSIAEFAKGIELESSVVGIIKTSTFWEVVGALAVAGVVVFGIWSICVAVANNLNAVGDNNKEKIFEKKGKSKKKYKTMSKTKKRKDFDIDDFDDDFYSINGKYHRYKCENNGKYFRQKNRKITNNNVCINKRSRNYFVNKTKNYKKYKSYNIKKRNNTILGNYKKYSNFNQRY